MTKRLMFFSIVLLISLGILFISTTNFMNLRYPINREEVATQVLLFSRDQKCFEPIGSYVRLIVSPEKMIIWNLYYSKNTSECVITNIPMSITANGIVDYKVYFETENGTLDITRYANKTSHSLFIKVDEEAMGVGHGITVYLQVNNTFSNFYRIFTQFGILNQIEFVYDSGLYNCNENCFSFLDTKVTDIQPIFRIDSFGAKEIRTSSDRIFLRFNPEYTFMAILQPISISSLSGSFIGIISSLPERKRNRKNGKEEFL